MMENPNSAQDMFNMCSLEDQQRIALSLDTKIASFLPLKNEVSLSSLKDLLKILSTRKHLQQSSTESDLLMWLVGSQALNLIKTSYSFSNQGMFPILFKIFEITSSLLKEKSFIAVAGDIINDCKTSLLSTFDQLWLDGPLADSPKAKLNIDILESVFSRLLKYQDKTMTLCDNNMHILVLRLSTCPIDTFSSQVTLRLLPKLMAYEHQPLLIQELWDLIASQTQALNGQVVIKRESIFMLICSLIEYFLPDGSSDQAFVLQKNEFWQIIQIGITHKDQVIRKQARYLLKRALDFITSNNVAVQTEYFFWNNQNTIQDWDQFFLVIESLEEKQVHLIKPMFPLVENIFQTMELQWSLCALHQVINHDNNFIVKWGLNFFFQHLSETKRTEQFVIQTILPALNNTIIYHTETEPISEISAGLGTVFQNIASRGNADFFKYLLKSLASISWAPVPLFHISQALECVSTFSAWDSKDLLVLKKFLIEVLASHSIFLRAASQSLLLHSMLSLTNTEQIDLSTVADIFATLNNSESIIRGSRDWSMVTEWLKKYIDPTAAEHFVIISLNYINQVQNDSSSKIILNSKAISRCVILLYDAELLTKDILQTSLQRMTSQLSNCASRLYIDQGKVDATLELLTNLFGECKTGSSEKDKTRELLVSIVLPLTSDILSYLHIRLGAPLVLHDFHAVQIYLATLDMMASSPQLAAWTFSQDLSCIDTAILILDNSNVQSVIQKYYAAQIIEWCSRCILKEKQEFGYKKDGPHLSLAKVRQHIVDMVNGGELNSNCPRPAGKELTRDLQALWGRMTSDQLKATWSTLLNLLQLEEISQLSISPDLPCSDLLEQALEGIEIGGPQILPPIMAVLRYFIFKEEDKECVKKILKKCYSLSFEYRKTDLFWLSIKQFIYMVFNKDLLSREDLEADLSQFTESLFEHSQVVMGLYNVVIQQVTSDPDIAFSETLALILRNGLLFGPALRKDQRIDHRTCLYIESLGEKFPVNALISSMCTASQEVRAKSVSFLLCAAKKQPALLESVARQLVQEDQIKTSRKNRYFADSHLHRIKHRTAQMLLLFQPYFSDGLCEELLAWACNSLVEESHQPSVRYLLEWLIVRLLLSNSGLEETFLNNMKKSSEKRQGSVTSYISMLYLWVQGRVEQCANVASLAELASKLILPWSMAQQYNLRLYAQVALMRIWTLCGECGYDIPEEKDELDKVVARYSPLQEGLMASLEQGSGVKNALRLQDDFYFSVFKPISHFTFETIFYEVPRLSNITQDEWIVSEMFGPNEDIQTKNNDSVLKEFNVANWILKSTGGGHAPEVEDEVSSSVVQRKVTPWKDMFPEQTARERRKEGAQGGLIVVASLVDRAPNLGGLSRTCEVLVASELILGNLKITEDPLFQSLSVSAEKWINLSEVKALQLPRYLGEMKKQGYTLVAAEQTSHSVPLHQMIFPKKTLLLLGNEKEGIPAELLPLLDVCVEVPQHGVIRSLNVHVTGALFVWQYFQQHQLASC